MEGYGLKRKKVNTLSFLLNYQLLKAIHKTNRKKVKMPKKKILVADDDLEICHADTAVRCIFRKLRIVRGKHQQGAEKSCKCDPVLSTIISAIKFLEGS